MQPLRPWTQQCPRGQGEHCSPRSRWQSSSPRSTPARRQHLRLRLAPLPARPREANPSGLHSCQPRRAHRSAGWESVALELAVTALGMTPTSELCAAQLYPTRPAVAVLSDLSPSPGARACSADASSSASVGASYRDALRLGSVPCVAVGRRPSRILAICAGTGAARATAPLSPSLPDRPPEPQALMQELQVVQDLAAALVVGKHEPATAPSSSADTSPARHMSAPLEQG